MWKTVFLRPEHHGLHVRQTDLFVFQIGHRFSHSLQCIELPMELITAEILHELANKCANLKYLTLDFSTAMQLHDFNDLNVFPCNLKMLCICLSEVIFLEGFMRRIYTYLSSLEILQIIGIFIFFSLLFVLSITTHTIARVLLRDHRKIGWDRRRNLRNNKS